MAVSGKGRHLVSATIEERDEDLIVLRFSDGLELKEDLYHPHEGACLQMETSPEFISVNDYKIIERELIRFSVAKLGFKTEEMQRKELEIKVKKIISEYESKTGMIHHEKQSVLFDILMREFVKV